jgi:hypothetical protein
MVGVHDFVDDCDLVYSAYPYYISFQRRNLPGNRTEEADLATDECATRLFNQIKDRATMAVMLVRGLQHKLAEYGPYR